jgi:hypothetical protein
VAAISLAVAALREQRLDDARSLAQAALRRHPFAGEALRVLGAVAELRGDRQLALRMMTAAAKASPRDTATQFWLAINALSDHDLPLALNRLDHLLRTEPELLRDAFPVLATIGINPMGAQALAPILAAKPGWRAEFVSNLLRQAPLVADLAHLVHALQKAGGQLTDAEFDIYAQRLFAAGEWERLKTLLAGAQTQPNSALIRDGGFDGTGRGPLLGWEVAHMAGVDAVIAGSQLQLVFYGKRVPFRNVQQLLLLPPGSYRLGGRVRLEAIETTHGLAWTLTCPSAAAPFASTEHWLGNQTWRDFWLDFDVPPDCPAQTLRLELRARIHAEQQISGRASFDALTITPR